MLAYGTDKGFLFIEHFPDFKRLLYITHYKPLFKSKISAEAIVQIAITDDGVGPVLVASTKQKIHVFKWIPKDSEGADSVIREITVVDISDEE